MSLVFCTGLVGTDFSGFEGEIVAEHSFTPAAEQRREAEMSLKRSEAER